MMDIVERERWVVVEPGIVGPKIVVALESGNATELNWEDSTEDLIELLEAELVGGAPSEGAIELPGAEFVRETPSEDPTELLEPVISAVGEEGISEMSVAGKISEALADEDIPEVWVASELWYAVVEAVPMIVGNDSRFDTEVMLLLDAVVVSEFVTVPSLLETEVGAVGGPVSTQEQAEDTLEGSLSHLDTNFGSPVVAVFTLAV